MKKALPIALVATLLLILSLGAAQAQEITGDDAANALLSEELARMEAVFNELEYFMGELVTEIKGNMADIDYVSLRIEDLNNILKAIAAEIKVAEGRIVGLTERADTMATVQQEFRVRVVALEAGLSELAAAVATCCAELESALELTREDLAELAAAFDAWIADYQAFRDEYAAFGEYVLSEIAALSDNLGGRIDDLSVELGGRISMLESGVEDLAIRVQKLEDEDVGSFKKKVLELERAMNALSIRVENNRTKLEGFDHAIAGLARDIGANKASILANMSLIEDHEARIGTLEGGTALETAMAGMQEEIGTLYFVSILALLAGAAALIWGFIGNQ